MRRARSANDLRRPPSAWASDGEYRAGTKTGHSWEIYQIRKAHGRPAAALTLILHSLSMRCLRIMEQDYPVRWLSRYLSIGT